MQAPINFNPEGEIVMEPRITCLIDLANLRASQINGCAYVTDDVYPRVHKVFNERELADLTLAIVAINGWNRLNIALRTVPGTYQPAASQAV
jgi:alkylhydroperoxidase family enzyme